MIDVRCVSVDPGNGSPAHCVHLADGRSAFAQEPIELGGLRPRVYLEGQYVRKRRAGRMGAKSFGVLRWAAGSAFGAYKIQGCEVYVLDPEVWREAVMPGCARADKIIFHNRCRRAGIVPKTPLPEGFAEDAYDAWLLGVAGERLHAQGKLPAPQPWRTLPTKRKPRHARSKSPARNARRARPR